MAMLKYMALLIVAVALVALVASVKLTYAQSPPPFVIVNEAITPSNSLVGVSKVSLTLQYTGSYYMYNASFTLAACGYQVSPSSIFINWISPNQEFTLTYLINGTLPVNCTATLQISWSGEYKYSQLAVSYIEVSGPGSTSVAVPLTIIGEPNISFTVGRQYLIYGVLNLVNIVVSNNGGGPIYNMYITLQSTAGSISPSSIYIGTLNPGSSKVVTVNVVPITSGGLTISLSYSGMDALGNVASGTTTLVLSTVSMSASQVMVIPLNTTVNVGLGTFKLAIVNLNPLPIYNITLGVTSIQGTSIESGSPISIPYLGPGGRYVANLTISTPLTSSSINLAYVLTFTIPGGYPEALSGSITIPTYGSAGSISISLVNTTYSPGPGTLTLRILNPTGLTLYNVTLIINPGYLQAPDTEYSIGNIPPNSVYYVKIPVVIPIATSAQSIGYTLYYSLTPGGLIYSVSGSLQVNIMQTPQYPLTVYSLNTTLNAGLGHLILGVVNNEPVTLSNVTLIITSANGLTINGPLLHDLGSLRPGETKYVELPIASPITSSQASISYIVTYSYPGGSGSASGSLTLSIGGLPDILLTSYQVEPTVASIGSSMYVSLTLTNIGPVSAYNLNVTLILPRGFTALSSPSLYLGTLSSQSSTNVAFTLIPHIPYNRYLTIMVSYVDQYGVSHVSYYEIPVRVISNSSSTGPFFNYTHAYPGYGYGNVTGFVRRFLRGYVPYATYEYTVGALAAVIVALVISLIVVLVRRRR